MIDTHSHVNFNTFKDDADKVIQSALDKKIAIINVGSQISTSRRAVELAKKYSRVFAAIGLHPIQLQDEEVVEEGITFTTRKEEFNYDTYKELAKQLPGQDLVHVMVFSDGLHINGTALVKGLTEILPDTVSVTGGLVGDGSDFKHTFVGLDSAATEKNIV
ncbi:MAG: hypothetical protein UT02_C0037G0001, partial [Parcubacteria group bacterium GW2011_GWC2_38_7]